MNVVTVIRKIGSKILSIVEAPLKYADMVEAFFADAAKDYPQTESALSGLVSQLEGIGPDALAALAANGFNIGDDVKAAIDLKGLFAYVKGTLLPTIQADYADYQKDAALAAAPATAAAPAPAAAVPVASAPAVSVEASGLAPA